MHLTDIGVLWTQQGAHIIKVHQQKCFFDSNQIESRPDDGFGQLDLNLVLISYQMDLN